MCVAGSGQQAAWCLMAATWEAGLLGQQSWLMAHERVWQVAHIRWFYRRLLEKTGGGPLNPAESAMVKDTLKALSFILGRRRKYVPKALSASIVKSVMPAVVVTNASEMTAAAQMVREFVLGQRAADQFLSDWDEISIEKQVPCE